MSDSGPNSIRCTNEHDGQKLVSDTLNFPINELFTIIFTHSQFFDDFQELRKNTVLQLTEWEENSLDNTKTRLVSLIMTLPKGLGPKTSQCLSTQVILPCSKPEYLYSIDEETLNEGIPYADRFKIQVHFCLERISDNKTSITVYGKVVYNKSILGFIKSMIEKNALAGVIDTYSTMFRILKEKGDEYRLGNKRRVKRKAPVKVKENRYHMEKKRPPKSKSSHTAIWIIFFFLLFLLLVNAVLYGKVLSLEKSDPFSELNVQFGDIHNSESAILDSDQWKKLLEESIDLLKRASVN
ncbi:protein Aster-B-like [Aethina tumida]|uniref:protein Aster-B-like n=1 Tax=Aethina tumida TaxID=116153 RepID=UPI0021485C7D|nr:protein Aster-B-like [Aethina tumida]